MESVEGVGADPGLEQFFLVSPEKLLVIFKAADVQPTDRVVELGAGVGTVAKQVPACASLTLVELDQRLVPKLRQAAPHASIVVADAQEAVRQLPCDVLLGSLPHAVTDSLLQLLPGLVFKTAVLAVGECTDLSVLGPDYLVTELGLISGDDFSPPQPTVSRLVKITPIS